MLFFRKKYTQFLLKSTNEHGVHSPFVYSLLTECFYKKKENTKYFKSFRSGFPPFFGLKQIHILNDLFSYLKVEKVFFLTEENHAVRTLFSLKNAEVYYEDDFRSIYIDRQNFDLEKLSGFFEKLPNNGFLVVEDYYAAMADLDSLTAKLKNSVVVDTYYFTLVFKRKQQVEETFFIRI